MESDKKPKDTRLQLHVWGKMLEGRIALQKVLVATRALQDEEPDESSVKSVQRLLSILVRLRDTYRNKSQLKIIDEADTDTTIAEQYSNITDEVLDEKHDIFESIRNDTIDKWYEKTRIGTIPKKGYTALELPTNQLINNALKDKERLIRRTQLDRTAQKDEIFDIETFNDDDFYHQLLKEVISKDENRRWVELQRLRGKVRRKADTKASKGRKIKKHILPKLVNFMAPSEGNSVPEQIRSSIVKSLFGAK